jgi:predicted nucleic acid-binding protein
MKYVLDASVALKRVLKEQDTAKADQVQDEFRRKLHELLAPDLFPVEVAQAWAKAERRGIIPRGDADQLLTEVLSPPPQLDSYLPLLRRALDIASQARIGVYDCLYVALAERESCELLTADDRLARSVQPIYPFIKSLESFP